MVIYYEYNYIWSLIIHHYYYIYSYSYSYIYLYLHTNCSFYLVILVVGFLAVSGDCESHGGPFSVSVEMGQMVSDGVHITVAYQQEKWAYACVYTHIYIYMYNMDTCNILQSYDIIIHRDTLKTNTTWAQCSISLVAPVLRR
jgi:hypothetical protein